jgi:hypothetical protein
MTKSDDKVKEQISVINQITIKTFIITTNFNELKVEAKVEEKKNDRKYHPLFSCLLFDSL